MARKRLIKGANAARVEERIARVPADMGLEAQAESSIFDALRALEGAATATPPTRALAAASSPASVPGPSRTPPSRAPSPKSSARAKPKPSKAAASPRRETRSQREAAPTKAAARLKSTPEPKPALAQKNEPSPRPQLPLKASRLSPSDFSAAEREAIVRCCSDYKNRLPTYLLAVQKEVKVIDSVIDKCLTAKGHPRKN